MLGVGFPFRYVTFDYVWWVLLAYLIIRLSKSDNPHWWIAIGAAVGVPETLIAVGFSREFVERHFESVELVAHNTNRYGVKNEETERHPGIFVCRKLREPCFAFWKNVQYYG